MGPTAIRGAPTAVTTLRVPERRLAAASHGGDPPKGRGPQGRLRVPERRLALPDTSPHLSESPDVVKFNRTGVMFNHDR
jgi:hypothetical protein